MTSITIDRRDGLSSSTAIKGPCRVATTANIALYGEQTIDGVAIVTGDRVLVKDQTDAKENGIYVVDTGGWRRSADFRGNRDVVQGTRVYVVMGIVGLNSEWAVTTPNPIEIGESDITFVESLASIISGYGLFSVRVDVEAAIIPAIVTSFQLAGYAIPGDSGHPMTFVRVGSEPTHQGKIQSADGAWWELEEWTVTPEMFGVISSDPADALANTQATLDGRDYLTAKWGGGTIYLGAKNYLLTNSNAGASGTFDFYALNFTSQHANIRLRGDGDAKLMLVDGANCSVIQIGQLVSPYDSAINVEISGFEIDGNRDNQDDPEASAKHYSGIVVCHNSSGIKIQDMYIHNCQYYGIGFEQDATVATLTGFQNCHVCDVVIEDTGADGMDCKDFRHNSYGNTIDNLIVRRWGLAVGLLSGQAGLDMRSGWSCRNIRISEFGTNADQVGIRFQVSSEVTTVPVQSSSLEDFTIKGSNGATNIGIRALQFGLKIGRGKVTDCQDGVNFSYPDTRISDVTCSNNVNGFRLWQSTPTSQEADIASCFGLVARDNTGTGLIVDSVDECSFLGCDIRGNLVGVDLRTGCNSIRFLGGSLSGNTTNLLDPDNAGKFEQVSGFRTANRIISSNILIDAAGGTGTKNITFNHGLAVTPALSDVSLTLLATAPVGDWSMGFLWVTSVTASQINAQIRVLTTSATVGAFVNVMATVKAKNQ